jgi:hypothetical protein
MLWNRFCVVVVSVVAHGRLTDGHNCESPCTGMGLS